ncbi:Coronin-7 [Geodia barretti]|uniref:Coronin-7 n=1 Tax=Geodia barretti TaxID=519541 RepID=A0AA35X977_GEOBA|nr:Coronin-7 [Geodia barretti]
MAHLPQDELPSEFDVVVDGTGLVQSILAAALLRARPGNQCFTLIVDLLSGRDGGSDHGEQLQSLHRVQGSQRDIQLQTQLNLVAMKSESTLMFYEVSEKSPYLSQGPNVYRGAEQQKGMGMVPKRAVNVMSCQIARFLQLTQNSIIPVGYHVQRKVAKVSLDPTRQPKAASQPKSHSKQNGTKSPEIRPPSEGKSPTPGGKSPTPDSRSVSEESRSSSFSPTPKVLNIVRSSKFRHVQGGTLHRSTHIEKLPKLSVASILSTTTD